jgi:hypothetical protein
MVAHCPPPFKGLAQFYAPLREKRPAPTRKFYQH